MAICGIAHKQDIEGVINWCELFRTQVKIGYLAKLGTNIHKSDRGLAGSPRNDFAET